MATILKQTYAFCGAHIVSELGGLDDNLHGHTWEVEFAVHVPVPPGKGCRFDHARFDALAAEVLGPINHRYINKIPGLDRGTNEVLAAYLAVRAMEYIEQSHEPMYGCLLESVRLIQYSPNEHYRLVRNEVEMNRDDARMIFADQPGANG